MKTTQSILLYSHDGQGLGHLKRNYSIACHAAKEFSGSRSLLLMDNPSVPFRPLPQGVDFVKLPSMMRDGAKNWKPKTLPVENERIKNLRASLIWTTAEAFDPDIFLVDFMPMGIWNDLIPTLQMLKERPNPPKIIFGIRDIIDDPEVIRREWDREGYYDVIRNFYDYVFIYGSPEIFDTAYHYGLVGDLKEKVRYCGYVNSDAPDKSRQEMRDELNIKREKLAVITAGGGGDAFPMLDMCLDAIALLKDEIPFEYQIITGPVMSFEDRKALEEKARDLPVKIISSSDEIINIMNAADLLIARGGYNTMMDVARLKKPTLIIPRDRPKKEQVIRAQMFSHLGFVNALNPLPFLSCKQIADAVKENIDQIPSPIRELDFNGQSNALFYIKQMVSLEEEVEIIA